MLAGVLVATELGVKSVVFYLFVYLIMNMAAFAVVIARERETGLGDDIDSVAGIGATRPALAWPLTIAMLGLAGLPGTAGFLGKFFLIEAAVDGDFTWLGVVIVIGSMLSLVYYLRVIAAIWMEPGAAPVPAHGRRRLRRPTASRAPLALHSSCPSRSQCWRAPRRSCSASSPARCSTWRRTPAPRCSERAGDGRRDRRAGRGRRLPRGAADADDRARDTAQREIRHPGKRRGPGAAAHGGHPLPGDPPRRKRGPRRAGGDHDRVVLDDDVCTIVALQPAPVPPAHVPDGLPLPPPEFVGLTMGIFEGPGVYEGFLESGATDAEAIRDEVRQIGAVLDFGCGCARVLRHWSGLPDTRVHGSDFNPHMIDWCRRSLPFAGFSLNRVAPPLEHEDESFDLVYAVSVFTHLLEPLQLPWLTELARVVRPGGRLLLSLNGVQQAEALLEDEGRERFRAGELAQIWAERAGTNACTVFHPGPLPPPARSGRGPGGRRGASRRHLQRRPGHPAARQARKRVEGDCHGSAVDLERHDHLRDGQRAREAVHGDRVEDHPLPPRPCARREQDREPAHLLEGGQGGPLQGGRQGLRGLRGQVRGPRAGRDQGGGRRPRQGRRT